MENIYNLAIGISGLILTAKFHYNKYFILLLLFFWYGFFQYLMGFYFDFFKIFLFLFSFFLLGIYPTKGYDTYDRLINLLFVLFSVSFWLSYYLNPFSIISAGSQYFLKYVIPILLYHWYKSFKDSPALQEKYVYWIAFLVLSQCLFSLFKIGTIGFREMTVGSMQWDGGQIAVGFPLAALLFYWNQKSGKLSRNDWLLLFSFLLISVASVKRTPVFLFPVFLFLLSIWVTQNKALLISILQYTPVVLLLLYLGLRLNPSLNPENKVWGSFDLKYAINYAMGYQFGIRDGQRQNDIIDTYPSSSLALFFPDTYQGESLGETLFGHGMYQYKFLSNDQFNAYYAGPLPIMSKSVLSGAFIDVKSFGILCFVLFLSINIIIVMQTPGRMMWVVMSFYLYVYFFYTSNVFTQPPILLTILPVIFNSKLNRPLKTAKTPKMKISIKF